jgi:predicted N-formylglutamate amidohydrolase
MNTTDYTVPRHAFSRGLRYLELEVRQDLIGPDNDSGREEIASMLAQVLPACA